MKKVIIRFVCFGLLLLTILNAVNRIFKVKYGDGIYSLTKFYELEDHTVDVLVLGSSHAFENFNTGLLWDEYGMAAYVLAGSVQPMWNTYYYLKEALKTQTPEVIVLEGYMVTYQQEYSDDSRIIKNNYGLKWSTDKLQSMMVSVPWERWGEFMLEYIQYHNRYAELSSEDFLEDKGEALYRDWKGFGCNMRTEKMPTPVVEQSGERLPLFQKTETYYRKTIELAQENNIPVIVVIAPYAGITEEEQKRYDTAEKIAEEYGVEFRNYNLCYADMGIDFATDAADPAHLNYKGNQKFSRVVGRYLKDHYEILDRSGNSFYQSWKNNADIIRGQIKNQELKETEDMISFLQQVEHEDYSCVITIDGKCHSGMKEIEKLMDAFHISKDMHRGMWYVEKDEAAWYSGGETTERYVQLGRRDVCMKRIMNEDGVDYRNILLVDHEQYQMVENGVNIMVYSKVTQTIADSVGFDAEDSFRMVR